MRVIYPADLFVLAFGAAVLFVWFVLFAAGYRHAALFDKLAKEDYPLKELYFVGFALLKYVKIIRQRKTAGGGGSWQCCTAKNTRNSICVRCTANR